jgi:hypothetical protein
VLGKRAIMYAQEKGPADLPGPPSQGEGRPAEGGRPGLRRPSVVAVLGSDGPQASSSAKCASGAAKALVCSRTDLGSATNDKQRSRWLASPGVRAASGTAPQ